jgi:hypothetical protein
VTDGDDDGGGSGGDGETSNVEKAVMAVSIAFTVALFAFAGWQMIQTPVQTAPEATVIGTNTLENGSVAVSLRLRNPADVGFVSVTVESPCTNPPAEVSFSYVPADTIRTGTIICPSGTTDPTVEVSSWVQA